MKLQILILTTVCILISGCGLFNRSSRKSVESVKVETSKSVNVSTETQVKEVTKSEDKGVVIQNEDNTIVVYPSRDRPVIIKPDGTVTAEVDSIVQRVRRNTEEARNIVQEVVKTLDVAKDSISSEKSSNVSKSTDTEKESKPSFFGTIGMWVGVGLLAIAVIWAIARFAFNR